MLEQCKKNEKLKLNINMKNEIDSSTIYGQLFYNQNLEYYIKNDYRPAEKLKLLLELYDDEINKNMPQFSPDGNSMISPIYYYIKNIKDPSLKDKDSMVNSEKFKEYFG